MPRPKRPLQDPAEIRRRAELLYLEREASGEVGERATTEAARLVHELQVHQIELEIQNEELRRARGELEVLLDRYSDLYDFAPVGYFTLGRDGKVREANFAGARLVGVERSGLLGRKLSTFVARRDRTAFDALVSERPTGETRRSLAVALVAASPEAEPVYVDLTFAVTPDGDECRVVAVDVSAHRKAEQGLRTSHKMEAIGRLAGGVAHDFNNLLGMVLAHADVALEALPPGHEAAPDLETVKAVAMRAADLTRQLLTFSQGQPPHVEPIDVNELTRSVARMLGPLLGADIEIALALSPGAGQVRADRSQVEQILVNLAVNARDAMPLGGRLTVATATVGLVEPSGGRYIGAVPGPYVVWTVTDTGTGIDEATKRHLFEPFVTTKAPDRGTGFGLATVYGIVKQCQGDIAVHTRTDTDTGAGTGTGTTFEVFLPRVDAAIAELPSEAVSRPAVGGTETILVVDDEALLRTVAARILERVGYTVLCAADGEEALEVMARHVEPIHLTVSDVRMPRMGGFELVRRIRALDPAAKVLLVSGFADGDLPSRPASGVRLIGKPFTAEVLRSTVRAVLDG